MSNLVKWGILAGILATVIALIVGLGLADNIADGVSFLVDKLADFIELCEPYFMFARALVNRLVGVPALVTALLGYWFLKILLKYPIKLVVTLTNFIFR